MEREIFEEMGITIKIDRYLATSYHTYPHISIELIGFLATYIDGVIHLTDHDAIEWVTPGEMDEYKFAPADVPLVKEVQRIIEESTI